MAHESPLEPGARRFRRTLASVLIIQALTLGLLWWLQSRYLR